MAIDTYVISSSGKATIKKDPDAILDYTFDWTDYLADIADTIASATVILSDNLTQVSIAYSTTAVKAFISGGVLADPGQPAAVETATCRIVTAGGRTDDRTIYLKIVAK